MAASESFYENRLTTEPFVFGGERANVGKSLETGSEKEKGTLLYDEDVTSGKFDISKYPPLLEPTTAMGRSVEKHEYIERMEAEKPKGHSIAFLRALRPQFIEPILSALANIQPYAQTSGATMYVDMILHKIRQMQEFLLYDSINEVLRSFYDALAYEGNWVNYDSQQFQKARDLINEISKFYPITQGEIERAILKLDELGFEILPYPFIIDAEKEEEECPLPKPRTS